MPKPVKNAKFSDIAKLLLAAIFISQIGLAPIATLPAGANYTSWNTDSIVYNNGVCNLGNPANHLSEESALQISTADELWEITDCVSSSARVYFKLTNNINVDAASFAPTNSPIGYSASGEVSSFSGSLLGNGMSVTGISLSSSVHGVGLFMKLDGAEINNLSLFGALSSNGTTDSIRSSGALAAISYGGVSLSSVLNLASVTGINDVGGLIGKSHGDTFLTRVSNYGDVIGSNNVGGLIGRSLDGNISVSLSINDGSIDGSSDDIGGLIGDVGGHAFIESSQNLSRVEGNQTVGGLIGHIELNATVVASGNFAEVEGNEASIGGLIGEIGNGYFSASDVVNGASVSGASKVAGLVGEVSGSSTIFSSRNTGPIDGSSGVGGLVGEGKAVSILSSSNTGPIEGSGDVGGLVGDADEVTIRDSKNFATVLSSGNDVGGLAGAVRTLTASEVENSGRVTGDEKTGGLLGSSTNYVVISSATNSSNVQGRQYAGGLVGYAGGDLQITNSENRGATGTDRTSGSLQNHAGGFVGYVAGNLTVSNLVNSVLVLGLNSVGGIAGRVIGDAYISEIQNSGDVSGRSLVGGLVGSAEQDLEIRNALNSAQINSQNSGSFGSNRNWTGGLAGRVSGDLRILGSTNSGQILGGNHFVGGMVGLAGASAAITSSHNLNSLEGLDQIGGLLGEVTGFATLVDVTSAGRIEGRDYVGGIAGKLASGANILSAHNESTVVHNRVGANYFGGLVGQVGGSLAVTSSSNVGAVRTNDGNYAGGLFGLLFTQDVSIESSFNTGNVRSMLWSGGIAGYLNNAGAATISQVFNSGYVRTLDTNPSGKWAGGIFGYTNTNNGSLSIYDSFNSGEVFAAVDHAGGLTGYVLASSDPEVVRFINSGEVSSGGSADGIVSFGDISATAIVSTVTTSLVAVSSTQSLQIATTFPGFDFQDTWGFGACSEERGFPLLRVFNQVETYYAEGCFEPEPQSQTQPEQDQVLPAAPVYMGPIVSGVSKQEGVTLIVRGNRLNYVTSAFVGDNELSIKSQDNATMVLEMPTALDPGLYDLVAHSKFGTLTVQSALEVDSGNLETIESSSQVRKLTVATFKGVVAIYTKGYEGQRLSAKIAGKWLVVPELRETWKGTNLSRTIRRVTAQKPIKVQLYINREFVRTEELITR